MIKNGREVRFVNSSDETKENEYIVALKTTTSPIFFDYHFARRLSDGTWADKQGVSVSRWNKLDGTALVWDGPFFWQYNSDTVFFAVKEN